MKRDFMDPNYMQREHQRGPVDLIFHGDTGCYTMLMFEPYSVIFHSYSGMGLGGGTGAGLDRFVTNKQIAFMGDSTFFHGGMVALSDSIKHGQDIAYIILDNKTTAMTGHQPTPASDVDVMGYPAFAQDIESIVKGMVDDTEIPVLRTNPADRDTYRKWVERMVLQDGVKVIIADKECAITYHRRTKSERDRLVRRGFTPEERYINVTPEVCEFCLECTKATGCPGLTVIETPYGPKVATDRSSCVSDGACVRAKACPAFEEVTIRRSKPSVHNDAPNAMRPLPLPPVLNFEQDWSIHVAGVGGMGVGVITAILVQAGTKEGYVVRFSERKGLAIRNGSVYSQITFARDHSPGAPIIPYGKADLILGLDILEVARALDPQFYLCVASAQQTSAMINTAKNPTVTTLIGKDDFQPDDLEEYLKTYTRRDRCLGKDFSAISEQRLGNKIYTDLMMLGAAHQKGFLPLSLENLQWSIQRSVPPEEQEKNMAAFRLGRELVVCPEKFRDEQAPLSLEALLPTKQRILQRKGRRGRRLALSYEKLVSNLINGMSVDDATKSHLALRVYDLIQFENIEYAREYLDQVRTVYSKDCAEFQWEATWTVIFELYKAMLIKDEVYVAQLLTSPEKLERDKKRYNADETHGDRIRRVHFTRPKLRVFGRDFEFDWKARPWQLGLIKRMKFLRRFLPGWHKEEREFREWYRALVAAFEYHDDASYRQYVKALRAPEKVLGYRQVRYPKMDEARRLVRQLLGEETIRPTQDNTLTEEQGLAARSC
jgi:indolepyruvate ferredoxin oxidoreductase